jgi:hypothetical protein
MQSIVDKIKKRIYGKNRGFVFTKSHFLDLGHRSFRSARCNHQWFALPDVTTSGPHYPASPKTTEQNSGGYLHSFVTHFFRWA